MRVNNVIGEMINGLTSSMSVHASFLCGYAATCGWMHVLSRLDRIVILHVTTIQINCHFSLENTAKWLFSFQLPCLFTAWKYCHLTNITQINCHLLPENTAKWLFSFSFQLPCLLLYQKFLNYCSLFKIFAHMWQSKQ